MPVWRRQPGASSNPDGTVTVVRPRDAFQSGHHPDCASGPLFERRQPDHPGLAGDEDGECREARADRPYRRSVQSVQRLESHRLQRRAQSTGIRTAERATRTGLRYWRTASRPGGCAIAVRAECGAMSGRRRWTITMTLVCIAAASPGLASQRAKQAEGRPHAVRDALERAGNHRFRPSHPSCPRDRPQGRSRLLLRTDRPRAFS